MEKIPSNVQSVLCASNHINNYCKGVEELVYNALDAGATCIAIRIFILENTIQVIDNGCGVSIKDFNCIGQKYMTSKFIDLSTLKSAPNKYGFRGQSLANLINVSKTVKLISRHEKSEETWMKLFENGKEKQIKLYNPRPSKGTTVEVNGFLYNLNIQNKTIDILSELQNTKTFLEYLSLVHSNISLSLRDDSKNEIVFKMHKNRDMYQTLSTLYNIEKEDFQELHVEKHEYKVTALLGKSDKETERHFIFLNGKFISKTSKLHKIVNKNLSKHFKIGDIKKPKVKNINKDEDSNLFQRKIPFYFIFIKCPYIDYELSNSPKQSVLEFKDWDQVNKLLDKLIKFFHNDIYLYEANKEGKKKAVRKVEDSDTRKQVKNIMEKILGNNSKKPGPHVFNGIKGKQIKRKIKPSEKNTLKVINHNNVKYTICSNSNDIRHHKYNSGDCIPNKHNSKVKENLNKRKEGNANKKGHIKKSSKHIMKSCLGTHICKAYNSKLKKVSNNIDIIASNVKSWKKQLVKNVGKTKKPCITKDIILRKFELETDSVKKRCDDLDQRTKKMLDRINRRKRDMFVNKNRQFTNITKNVNVSIHKQIDEIVFHDYNSKTQNYNNNVGENVKKEAFKSNYDLIHTILKSQQDVNYVERQIVNKTNNNTVNIFSQLQPKIIDCESYKLIDVEPGKNSIEPMVTFQSHNYYAHQNVMLENDTNLTRYTDMQSEKNTYHTNYHADLQLDNNDHRNFHKRSRTFITKQSRDNFLVPNKKVKNKIFKKKTTKTGYSKQVKSSINRLFSETSKLLNLKQHLMGNTGESSYTNYTIEFTESNYKAKNQNNVRQNISNAPMTLNMHIDETFTQSANRVRINDHMSINTNTYTVSNIDSNGCNIHDENWNIYSTYTIEHNDEIMNTRKTHTNGTNQILIRNKASYDDIDCDEKLQNHRNYIFISKSQENNQNEQILDPINICETILDSQEVLDNEFKFSFNNRQNNLSNNFIHCPDLQKRWNDSQYNNSQSTYINERNRVLTEDSYPNHDDENNTPDNVKEVSHHFILPNNNVEHAHKTNESRHQSHNSGLQSVLQNTKFVKHHNQEDADDKHLKDSNYGNFNLKNRLCFVPKGMSPIFENCRTKNDCEYNRSEDYYEDEMYDNFADNVRNNAEIFEPKIQDAKELATKAIDKVNIKLNKDNSSLKFNGCSLKCAKVLGQTDEKFIAAILKGGSDREAISDFLVLFDQHAVHERIRLEKNLSGYLHENLWKPVNIDEITLKISEDDVLYLHNYKDKFVQLGLQWTVLNTNVISIGAIPEAILGKNPRPVDKVMKAVKGLITEEINIIKMQGGCVSLYPKSIMDLVFSEACRYAIKFGDKLTKSDCVELLMMLSNCTTPFQCAHGRPVMAVVMDIKLNKVNYKINLNQLLKWKGK